VTSSWFLIPDRLRVFENIMLRRLFGPEREEMLDFGEDVG